ncbi:MAG: isoprenylcysteine carboxylmethyltransferase family protein [Candidatus Thiodiazotropha sp.]
MRKILPPVLFMIAIMMIIILHSLLPISHLLHPPETWPGMVLLIGGLSVSAWHNWLFRRLGTNIHTFDEPDILVTQGLFRFSRNPMYLGFALALAGIALVLGTLTPFLVVLLFILIADRWYIAYEERAMTEKFGEAYLDYARRVRRWL